ncbi:MAG: holo-ACP synthase [Campylobacter sp.]|nr:holo-ACP synthase [Campylobacter sp.]
MLGVDIIAIARITRINERFGNEFLKKFLNQDEIKLAKNDASLAGFWAAKEAAAKALGCGICAKCGFLDIIISKNKKGAPKLKFSAKVRKKFAIKKADLSISHDGGFAIAAVILQKQYR